MRTVQVWDPAVRLFHWLLVIGVLSQLATAEDFNTIHVRVGYGIVALIAFRIAWGIIGPQRARFRDFVYPPAEIIAYLKGLRHGQAKRYLGHNPAGGAMVCALLLVLSVTTLTGLFTHRETEQRQQTPTVASGHRGAPAGADIDGDHLGHRSHDHSGTGASFWKEIHEAAVSVLLFLAGIHLCGVIASSYVHHENLIRAMITGVKRIE